MRRTASRSFCRVIVSSRRTASAGTATPGSESSGASSRSTASSCDHLRGRSGGAATITPERECDRRAELSALFHSAGSLHLRGAGDWALHLDLGSGAAARRAFARDFIYPMFRANAIYEGQYFLALHRASAHCEAQVEIAKKNKAETIAHGATGKGNDQFRFELTWRRPGARLRCRAVAVKIAPSISGARRNDCFCEEHKIPVEASLRSPNRWIVTFFTSATKRGFLEDPWFDASWEQMGDVQTFVRAGRRADEAEYVELDFAAGNCVAVNGKYCRRPAC